MNSAQPPPVASQLWIWLWYRQKLKFANAVDLWHPRTTKSKISSSLCINGRSYNDLRWTSMPMNIPCKTNKLQVYDRLRCSSMQRGRGDPLHNVMAACQYIYDSYLANNDKWSMANKEQQRTMIKKIRLPE